jgi:hypothetical protein
MIPYHFNYFLLLVTGIFDNLAITAREKHSLRFKDDRNPSRTSLLSATGEEFLKELKIHNPSLRNHINRYHEFINLIHKLRELAAHRQGFRSIGYGQKRTFKQFFVIDKEIAQLIKNCGDKTSSNERISTWGVHKNIFLLLEPCHFAKSAGLKLIEFADEYLKLLGFDIFLTSDIIEFQKHSLDAGRWKTSQTYCKS